MEPATLTRGEGITSSEGQRYTLGALVKSGGAGSVHLLQEDTRQVVKIYHASQDRARYERKLRAMLQLAPRLPDLALEQGSIAQLAWPSALAYDAGGMFRGFLMPKLDVEATLELECMLSERQARSAGLSAGLGACVTLAANLSAAVAELHRQEHYVVDMKPTNLRFHRQALYVALLDCDGFSVRGQGERFGAPQVTPDYLAPEFHGQPIAAIGEPLQDRFALAVIAFRLLNYGVHPFTGRPMHDRVPSDLPNRIARRCYAYGLEPNSDIAPSPVSFHELMPFQLRSLFDRAFTGDAAARPSADEWFVVLRALGTRATGLLQICARDASHQHFAGHACAACAREALLARTRAAASAELPQPGSEAALRQAQLAALSSLAALSRSGNSSSLGSVKVPGRDHRFLVIMLVVMLALSVGVSSWLVLGAANVSPYGPMYVPAPKRHRPQHAGVEPLKQANGLLTQLPPVPPAVLAIVHSAMAAAAVGTRANYAAQMAQLRALARTSGSLDAFAALAVLALKRAFEQRNQRVSAHEATQWAQRAAVNAALAAPQDPFAWSLLAESYGYEPDLQRAVGAFAIAMLLGSRAAQEPMLISSTAYSTIRERMQILRARGRIAAAELGGAPYTPAIQALAEAELPR